MANSELQTLAEEFAGNWHRPNFAWFGKPENPENWGLYHFETRDSGLLEESNAAEIRKEFSRFLAAGVNVRIEHFTHWAVGWIDALAIRVYDDRGRVTNAFRRLTEIEDRLEQYPVLNEDDYCERQYNATIDNIEDSAWLNCDVQLTDDQASEVYGWFWDYDQDAIEPYDDGGGYPDKDQIREALTNLGMLE
jgi:hypothetical protein